MSKDQARSAPERVKAIASGQQGWGVIGDSLTHQRYVKLLPGRYRNRRKCWCGCGGKISHGGYANGLAMTSGCEWAMRRWVKDPLWHAKAKLAALHTAQPGEGADVCATCKTAWPCEIARLLDPALVTGTS